MAQITFTNTGGITTTGTISTVKADIASTGTANNALLNVTDSINSLTAGYIHATHLFAPNMNTGTGNISIIGKTNGTKNSAYYGFVYKGNESNDNYLTLGHWNADDQMVIKASGNVGIGNTAPAYKLDVNGDTRNRGKTYIGTSGAYMQYTAATESIDFNFA